MIDKKTNRLYLTRKKGEKIIILSSNQTLKENIVITVCEQNKHGQTGIAIEASSAINILREELYLNDKLREKQVSKEGRLLSSKNKDDHFNELGNIKRRKPKGKKIYHRNEFRQDDFYAEGYLKRG